MAATLHDTDRKTSITWKTFSYEPPSKSLVLTKIQACDDIPTWVDMGGEIMNGLRRQQSVPILC